MNTDAIDAADILITELDEQAALLSQSGVSALTSGHFPEAKLIIDAIEKTQGLRGRAEQLKSEMLALYTSLPVASEAEIDLPASSIAEVSEKEARRQDRTDPVLMNAKRAAILGALEKLYNVRLNRRSAVMYRSQNNELGIVCVMSKWHEKNENYWYAFHTHQKEFLEQMSDGYFVIGMMDRDSVVAIPLKVIQQNLKKLNTTTAQDRLTYWHVHVTKGRGGSLWLQRAKGESPLPLDSFIVRLSN